VLFRSIGAASCERIVYGDHVLGVGKELFEAVRQMGGEGIVSKRRGSLYRGGESREWLKTKCSETGVFAITGFSELSDGKLDAVYVAEGGDGVLCPAGQVRFFVGKGLWHLLNERRAGRANVSGAIVLPDHRRSCGALVRAAVRSIRQYRRF